MKSHFVEKATALRDQFADMDGQASDVLHKFAELVKAAEPHVKDHTGRSKGPDPFDQDEVKTLDDLEADFRSIQEKDHAVPSVAGAKHLEPRTWQSIAETSQKLIRTVRGPKLETGGGQLENP